VVAAYAEKAMRQHNAIPSINWFMLNGLVFNVAEHHRAHPRTELCLIQVLHRCAAMIIQPCVNAIIGPRSRAAYLVCIRLYAVAQLGCWPKLQTIL